MKCSFSFLLLSLVTNISQAINNNNIMFQEREDIYVAFDVIHVSLAYDIKRVEQQCTYFRHALREVLPSYEKVDHLDKMWFNAAHRVKAACDLQHIHGTEQRSIHKRQAMPIIGGLAAVAGTLFGLFSFAKIQALAERVRRQEQAHANDLHILRHHETRMKLIERDILVVNSTLAYLLRTADAQQSLTGRLFWMQSFQIEFGLLEGHINIINSGWSQLLNQKFPVRWIQGREIPSLLAALQSKAEKMGGMLPLQHSHDLFHFPSSFIVEGTEILVFLHVPVVHERMKLYRHLPLPIQGNDTDYWRVRGEFDHVMVSEMNHYHKEVSLEMIAKSCHRIGGCYLCEHLGDLARKMTHSCLGSLFVQNMVSVQEKCVVETLTSDWSTTQIRNDAFLVFSRQPTMMVTECRNGTRRNDELRGVQEVVVPPLCQVYSEDFELRSSASSTMSFTLINVVEWNITGLQMRFLQGTTPSLTEIRVGATDEEEWIREDQGERVQPHLWIGIGLGTVSTILAVVAILYLAWRVHQNLRQPPAE
jgi:hypothetical protein